MEPWVTAEEILADEAFCQLDEEDTDLQEKAEDAAIAASEILSILSGGTILGERTVTVTPNATYSIWKPSPFQSERYADELPTNEITLNWPVISVDEVVIDEETLDASDYQVLNQSILRYTPDADGNRRWWPLRWLNSGTFTITYTFGVTPPDWASDAAKELAVSILRSKVGLGSPLPPNVTGMSRQNMNLQLRGAAEALRDKTTTETFPAVLRFISLINPNQNPMPSFAWSPDIGFVLQSVTEAPEEGP